jgi:hypothetical protein
VPDSGWRWIDPGQVLTGTASRFTARHGIDAVQSGISVHEDLIFSMTTSLDEQRLERVPVDDRRVGFVEYVQDLIDRDGVDGTTTCWFDRWQGTTPHCTRFLPRIAT